MITVTLSLDTNAYTAGDVLADTQEVTGFSSVVNSGMAYLHSIVVIDEDDQKIEMDLVFLNSNVSLGTENGAPNISDANARNILGIVNVASGDYVDLGGVAVATKTNIGLTLAQTPGTPGLWIGAITSGTPTHTASGVRVKLGFIRAV